MWAACGLVHVGSMWTGACGQHVDWCMCLPQLHYQSAMAPLVPLHAALVRALLQNEMCIMQNQQKAQPQSKMA